MWYFKLGKFAVHLDYLNCSMDLRYIDPSYNKYGLESFDCFESFSRKNIVDNFILIFFFFCSGKRMSLQIGDWHQLINVVGIFWANLIVLQIAAKCP